jgi:alpha-L-rhamnosidase
VTDLVSEGDNIIGALLAEGWYAGRTGMSHGVYGVFRGVYGKPPWFLAQLELEMENGERAIVASDATWLATKEGSIRAAALLDGEIRDAGKELFGWDSLGYEASSWQPVVAREEIAGLMRGLLCTESPPAGRTNLSRWAKEHASRLGRQYASELARRRNREMTYEKL